MASQTAVLSAFQRWHRCIALRHLRIDSDDKTQRHSPGIQIYLNISIFIYIELLNVLADPISCRIAIRELAFHWPEQRSAWLAELLVLKTSSTCRASLEV